MNIAIMRSGFTLPPVEAYGRNFVRTFPGPNSPKAAPGESPLPLRGGLRLAAALAVFGEFQMNEATSQVGCQARAGDIVTP